MTSKALGGAGLRAGDAMPGGIGWAKTVTG
jgi:hypothetical protein